MVCFRNELHAYIFTAAWCAAVDFYFALLPWLFIWNLNMKFKEKMSIAISLSLGFMCVITALNSYERQLTFTHRACVCGIIRTIDLGGLSSENYTGKRVILAPTAVILTDLSAALF
jgi:hypothetical protein